MGSSEIFDVGSSPRVRGKLPHVLVRVRRARLIPARAGKTPTSRVPPASATAHPRACGENILGANTWNLSNGSSPRVRGKRPTGPPFLLAFRLIPARAGKTSSRCSWTRTAWAHPRACGENMVRVARYADNLGSSPRVRGKRFPARRGHDPGGLIPARAGKTLCAATAPAPRGAHPRACGENCAWASG